MFLMMTAMKPSAAIPDGDVFLGDWCFRFPEAADHADSERKMLPYPFRTPEARLDAVKYSDRLAERIVDVLAGEITSSYGDRLSLGDRGWRIFLSPAIKYITMSAYHSFVCLDNAKRMFGTLATIGPVHEEFSVPRTTQHLQTLLSEEEFQLQILTEIAEAIGLSVSRQEMKLGSNGNKRLASEIYSSDFRRPSAYYHSVKRLWGFLQNKLASRAECIIYNANLTHKELFLIMAKSRFRIVPHALCQVQDAHWPSVDLDWRRYLRQKLLEQLSASSAVEEIIFSLVSALLPVSHLEGLEELLGVVEREFPRLPRGIASGMSWTADDAFKLWAGVSSKEGTRLISVQHGGGYAMPSCPGLSERTEYEIADAFLSWGQRWGGEKTVPLPVPQHLYLKTEVGEGTYLLYCGTTQCALPYAIRNGPGGMMLEYLERQRQFFLSVSEDLRESCLLRPNPDDWYWFVRQRMGAHLPWLRFDDSRHGFIQALNQARVVVVDNPSTTFLQSMGSGRPTILVWDWEMYLPNEQAAVYFRALEAANVYFRCPEQAAEKVREIWSDPLAWWHSDEVAGAVSRFLDYYFCRDEEWVGPWVNALLETPCV